jgi:soluble lytic murein transglycosylase-like protein
VAKLAKLNHLNPRRYLIAGRTILVPARAVARRAPVRRQPVRRYRVRVGDTLSGIAARHGLSTRTLARQNGLDPRRYLLAGTVLRIRGGHAVRTTSRTRAYRVRVGDTLSGIAARHGVTLASLAARNGLDPRNYLIAGTTLRLTGSATARTSGRKASTTTRTYRVRTGDTLSGIAARHRTSVSALARLNGLNPARILFADLRIRVPAVRVAPPALMPVPDRSDVRASIARWSAHYGVDASLVRALAWQESGFSPVVTSPVGAWGVMQIMPGTWSYVESMLLGQHVPRTADGNVRVGVAFLRQLLRMWGGNTRLALASYYQGAGSVGKHGLFPETRRYVANILALRGRV